MRVVRCNMSSVSTIAPFVHEIQLVNFIHKNMTPQDMWRKKFWIRRKDRTSFNNGISIQMVQNVCKHKLVTINRVLHYQNWSDLYHKCSRSRTHRVNVSHMLVRFNWPIKNHIYLSWSPTKDFSYPLKASRLRLLWHWKYRWNWHYNMLISE